MLRLVALAALVTVACAAPPVAAAQSSSELAEARRLFEAGLEAASDHRWADARDLFEQSLAVTERASTLLNLAAAQAETGAVVDSAASYRRFLEIATGRDARHRDEAEEALAAVEARIAHLELDVARTSPGDDIAVDDRTLLPAALAAPLALDPGTHHVSVTRDGEVVFEQEVTLADGARRSITIDVGTRAEAVAAVTTDEGPELTPATTATDTGGNDDGLFIGLGVGAGILVVAGVVVTVVLVTMPTGSGELYTGNVGDGMIRF